MKSNFSDGVKQLYAIYYPGGCDSVIGDHTCSTCDDLEHGRIRDVAFIKVSKQFLNPSNPAEWAAAIAAKDVIIIPQVNGSFDGGSEVEGTGYGDQVSKLTGYNFTATFKDPNYKPNAAFYNALKRSRNYYFAFKTETQLHIVPEVVSVIPKNPVTDSTTDEVTWEITVKWSGGDLPQPIDAPPGIFGVCFDYL